jgi:hypothetical protein
MWQVDKVQAELEDFDILFLISLMTGNLFSKVFQRFNSIFLIDIVTEGQQINGTID